MKTRRRAALAVAIVLGGGGALAIAAWPPALPVPVEREIVLEDVTLVNPGASRRAHQQILIQGGRIAAIGPSEKKGELPRYVLPGLIDMHVHLPPVLAPGLVDLFDFLFLAHGVTTIREVGSLDGEIFRIRREIEKGERPGPRIFACGRVLDGEPMAWPIAKSIRTRAEGEAAVAELVSLGADCVKVYEHIGAEALAGVREAAARRGLPVIGHLPEAAKLDAIPLSDVQHLCYTRCAALSPEEIEAFVVSSAEDGVAHTPTLVVSEGQLALAEYAAKATEAPYTAMPRFWREILWHPSFAGAFLRSPEVPDASFHAQRREALDSMKALVKRLHERGVRIHVGTDPIQPFVVPGASVRREMELLVEAGLSTEEALAAATSVAGETLGVADLGRLAVGAPADLLVLREDPTQDLQALGSLEMVVADGRVFTKEMLEDALEQQQRYLARTVIDLPLRLAARGAAAVARHSFSPAP